jgi:CheY-like chemotaxis protein
MTKDKSHDRKKPPAQKAKYLLVVGSDTGNVVYTSMLLQRLDYHICTAATAETALEIAQAVVPSLIISDLKLAGMSAAQMIRALRKKPSLADVPVIIKLEELVPKIVQKCIEAGAVACIKKPVDPQELYRVVQSAVESTPREHIRIKTRLSVALNNTPLDFDSGEYATMLSARGMYVRTRTLFPAKTKVPVLITLNDRDIIADATVIYSHGKGEGPFVEPGMGLYFKDIADKDQEYLKQYISGEITKGLDQAMKTDD